MVSDGYTVSDVVMYWRDEPVVGVEDAELPQFTIVGWETNERKIKLATGIYVTSFSVFYTDITVSIGLKKGLRMVTNIHDTRPNA